MRLFSLIAVACLSLVLAQQAPAQDNGQGKYVNSASARLVTLVNTANRDGYQLQDNSFSIGGGWLRQGADQWVSLYTINLQGGRSYRFLAVGDMDARDVDLQVVNAQGTVVASDTATAPEAIVNYTPQGNGQFTVRVRLYASQGNAPSVCISTVLSRR